MIKLKCIRLKFLSKTDRLLLPNLVGIVELVDYYGKQTASVPEGVQIAQNNPGVTHL